MYNYIGLILISVMVPNFYFAPLYCELKMKTPLTPLINYLQDLSQTGSKLAQIEQKKKPEPEIIDLTCDSSDDEYLTVKVPSRSPAQLSDDAAMSISSS